MEAAALLLVTAATLYATAKTLLTQAPLHIKAVPIVLSGVQLYNTIFTLRGSPAILPHGRSRTDRITWLGLQVINGVLVILIYIIMSNIIMDKSLICIKLQL